MSSTRSSSRLTKRTPPSSGQSGDISAYERARLAQIARNQAELRRLNLVGARNAIKTEVAASKQRKRSAVTTRGITAKKRPKRSKLLPARRSLRVQGKTPDGEALPEDFKALPQKMLTQRVYERTLEEERLKGDRAIVDGDGQDFLRTLLSGSSSAAAASSSSSSAGTAAGDAPRVSKSVADAAKSLAKLSIDAEHGVRKVTPDRIYSLAIMPSPTDMVVAAGDKKGSIALWNVGSEALNDGVFCDKPHSGTVSHLSWSRTDIRKLLTSSYDGSLTELDANKGQFTELVRFEDRSLYEFDSAADMSSILLADDEGDAHHLDLRLPMHSRIIAQWGLHEKKINTLRIHPTRSHFFITASLDRSVRLFDIRRMCSSTSSSTSSTFSRPTPVYDLSHELAVSCAVFSPDGSQMISNGCGPNVIKIYDFNAMLTSAENNKPNKTLPMALPRDKLYHNNKTGRWLTKFKPEFDPKRNDIFVVGCMEQPRCVEVFHSPPGTESGNVQLCMRLRDELVSSVQSLNAFHPFENRIFSANSSGRVSVWS